MWRGGFVVASGTQGKLTHFGPFRGGRGQPRRLSGPLPSPPAPTPVGVNPYTSNTTWSKARRVGYFISRQMLK